MAPPTGISKHVVMIGQAEINGGVAPPTEVAVGDFIEWKLLVNGVGRVVFPTTTPPVSLLSEDLGAGKVAVGIAVAMGSHPYQIIVQDGGGPAKMVSAVLIIE